MTYSFGTVYIFEEHKYTTIVEQKDTSDTNQVIKLNDCSFCEQNILPLAWKYC